MRSCRVDEAAAYEQLLALGCDERLRLERFERQRAEWEYIWDPFTDDLVPVRTGTSEWEMFA